LAEAQRVLDQAHERSGGARTVLTANLSAIVRGDGAFYVGHIDGQVFYTEIHPANIDVLERDATGTPTMVSAIVGDSIEMWTRETVTIDNGNSAGTYANPYKLIPIVIWPAWPRPGSYWGDSLIEQIRACQRLLNERQNTWAWLMRMQGNPPIKSIGTKGARLRSAPGEIWETEDSGVIIELVKLLDAETGDLHLNTIKLMLQTMRELANIPDIAYGIGNTQLSGVALKLAFAPMLQAANVRRALLASALRYRDRAILTMHNVLHGIQSPYVDTRIEFDGVLPTDEAQERQLNRYDVQVGTLSRASYMQRYNIGNPDNELDQIYLETAALVAAGAQAPGA
jgi:hypothetical protein